MNKIIETIHTVEDRKKFVLAQHEVITDLILEKMQMSRDMLEVQKKLADALQEVDLRVLDFERMQEERDVALTKVKNQAERIVYLEGATSHAGGTPLTNARRERDVLLSQLNEAKETVRVVAEHAENELQNLVNERDLALVEVNKLRQLFSKVLKALENGSECTATASSEFLQDVPAEVGLVVSELKKARDCYKTVAQELIAAIRINTLRQTWSSASPEDLDAWLTPWLKKLDKPQ
jgi:hypothetical protein